MRRRYALCGRVTICPHFFPLHIQPSVISFEFVLDSGIFTHSRIHTFGISFQLSHLLGKKQVGGIVFTTPLTTCTRNSHGDIRILYRRSDRILPITRTQPAIFRIQLVSLPYQTVPRVKTTNSTTSFTIPLVIIPYSFTPEMIVSWDISL